MNDQVKNEHQETPQTARPLLSGELERIKSVIDRVLWTAGATEWNKQLLAEAIADELGDLVVEEREACAGIVEDADTPDCGGWNALGIADAIRKRSNA